MPCLPGVPAEATDVSVTAKHLAWLRSTTVQLKVRFLSSHEPASHAVLEPVSSKLCAAFDGICLNNPLASVEEALSALSSDIRRPDCHFRRNDATGPQTRRCTSTASRGRNQHLVRLDGRRALTFAETQAGASMIAVAAATSAGVSSADAAPAEDTERPCDAGQEPPSPR